MVHRSFVNGLAIAMRDRNQLDPCHALQTQFCAPSPHREDEIQGDELARLQGPKNAQESAKDSALLWLGISEFVFRSMHSNSGIAWSGC